MKYAPILTWQMIPTTLLNDMKDLLFIGDTTDYDTTIILKQVNSLEYDMMIMELSSFVHGLIGYIPLFVIIVDEESDFYDKPEEELN